ncbi:response regulator transcription factor [Cohnella yongneupensis]|uniref:Response regulator transcription factor n=1 Tax=Cohnella yongneupensis TaxID=425006 RepID=A0ABW0R292_9BACL
MRILLVEDDRQLGKLLLYKLNKQYHQSDWVTDGGEALEKLSASPYDLYLLDWMVPTISGAELCRLIRGKQDRAPILMLTARDTVPDRVEGLMAGADDYLVKPFDFDELFARIHALERRKATEWNEEIKRIGNLALNTRTLEVSRSADRILLTKREFQLLSYFMTNAGRVLSREQLLDQVWGLDKEVTLNAVDALH